MIRITYSMMDGDLLGSGPHTKNFSSHKDFNDWYRDRIKMVSTDPPVTQTMVDVVSISDTSKFPIDVRLEALETIVMNRSGYSVKISGTTLGRQMAPKEGDPLQWCLGLGPISLPKVFFTGATIEDCISRAEEALYA